MGLGFKFRFLRWTCAGKKRAGHVSSLGSEKRAGQVLGKTASWQDYFQQRHLFKTMS